LKSENGSKWASKSEIMYKVTQTAIWSPVSSQKALIDTVQQSFISMFLYKSQMAHKIDPKL
jgi:hypothetical protein